MATLREKKDWIKQKKGRIKRLKADLKELVGEIKKTAAAADKALRVGVLHSVKTGTLLIQGKRKIVEMRRLETKLGINLVDPRPFRDWVENNFTFSIRTAQYWMKMARGRNRKEIKALLADPDVSARQVQHKLGALAAEGDAAVSHEPSGGPLPPPGIWDDIVDDAKAEELARKVKRALDRLCRWFRDTAKEWPASAVIHLAYHAGDRVPLLKRVTAEVERLAWRAGWATPRDRYRLAVLAGHIEDGDCIYTGPNLTGLEDDRPEPFDPDPTDDGRPEPIDPRTLSTPGPVKQRSKIRCE
jgi:hypothetical protein